MSTSKAGGSADNAKAATDDGRDDARNAPADERPKAERTGPEQDYLETLADEAEDAVKGVKQQIKELQESLKDREAAAKQARAVARGKGE
jgi:hypothetical protein